MKSSAIKGFCFGLTSGTITTLGMIVGLNAGTGSRAVVMGGILSIAIADSFSDALGIHVSEESDHNKSHREAWASTFATFFSKLLFASTFMIPIVFFELSRAITVSIVWGLAILGVLSFFIARSQKNNPLMVISEHLSIAVLVIILTHYTGHFIQNNFGFEG